MSLKFCFVTTRVFESLSMLAASYVAYQHRAAPHRVPPVPTSLPCILILGFVTTRATLSLCALCV